MLTVAIAFFQTMGCLCGNQINSQSVKVGVVVFPHTDFLFSRRFTLPGDVDIDGVSYEGLSTEDEPTRNAKERERRKRQELLKLVDFSK